MRKKSHKQHNRNQKKQLLRSIFFSHIPAIWKLSAVLLLTLTVLHLLLLTLTVLHLPPSLSSLPVILPLPLSSPAARTTADLRRITTITSLQHLALQLSPSYFSSHRSLSSTRPPPSVASYHYNKLITTIATCRKCSLSTTLLFNRLFLYSISFERGCMIGWWDDDTQKWSLP
jgi:hypothetical protein